jgi:uncharacterized membrane protein YozB (DUF420 family)
MKVTDLPSLNAVLNSISTILLLFGYINIKKGNRDNHKKLMVGALISSALFLISYLIYHAQVGSVPFPHFDWTRPVYYVILVPHVILAAVMVPFILLAVWHAWKERFEKHARITRWVWPVWMYVSFSGVLIYLMLYHL